MATTATEQSKVAMHRPLSIWIAGAIDDVSRAADTGLVDAIVTNPTVVADWCRDGASMATIARDLTRRSKLPLFLQTRVVDDASALVEEAIRLTELSPLVIPKLPATLAGLEATRRLAADGIRPLITTICTVRQALAFAANGAGWLCPYYSRLHDAGGDPKSLVSASATLIRDAGIDCPILPASIRTGEQIDEAMSAGAAGVIIFVETFRKMLQHPVTDDSLASFEREDWPRIKP